MIFIKSGELLIFLLAYGITFLTLFIYLRLWHFKAGRERIFDFIDVYAFPSIISFIIARLAYVLIFFDSYSWSASPITSSNGVVQLTADLPYAFLYMWQGIDVVVFLLGIMIIGTQMGDKIKKLDAYDVSKALNFTIRISCAIYIGISVFQARADMSMAGYIILACVGLILLGDLTFMFLRSKWKLLTLLYSCLSSIFSIIILCVFWKVIHEIPKEIPAVYAVYTVLCLWWLYRLLKAFSAQAKKSDVDKVDVVMKDWK